MLKLVVFMVCSVAGSSYQLPSFLTKHMKDSQPDILDLLIERGYPFEVHQVTTSDGYILTMFRIPHGRTNRTVSDRPVLLYHGMLASSDTFLFSDPTHSLGYVLADAGYDVWLGNSRGTHYSRNHTSLDPDKDKEFWQFSWHEVGMYDLPATIDYILNATNQAQLHYVGHSQGGTVFYVLATTRPEYNAKIKVQMSLAPVVYLTHTRDPIVVYSAVFLKYLTKMADTLNINEVASSHQLIVKMGKVLCEPFKPICAKLFDFVCAVNPDKLDPDMTTLLRYSPDGFSVRQVLHFLQQVGSRCFRWYDYGQHNLEVYGTERPKAYHLSLVTTPTYVFYSRGDSLVQEEDTFKLCKEINEACLEQILIADETFTHFELVLGKTAPELVYPKMLSIMRRY